MAKTTGTESSPANQVARGEPEPIVAALQLPLTVVESGPPVANAASLPVEKSNRYFNRTSPPWRPFPSAPFIPTPPPYSAQDISSPPVWPFGDYPGFYGPAASPWLLSYNNTPSPAMECSQGRPPFRTPLGPPRGLVFPHPNHLLHSKIVAQINYYFSFDNLVKDTYLRQNMDGNGWVSIGLIANFNKVKQLTDNIPMILHALQFSSVVEVWGDKVRRRYDWKRWILSPAIVFPRGRFSNESNDKSKKEESEILQ